ncbi:unnamed protein product [Calypogeia fissa]
MAELAAANTVFGVVAKIYTCCDVGWRIIKRVNEFVNNTGDVPEVLIDIKAQLPLLIEKMEQLKSLGDDRLTKINPQGALAAAVTGCRSHIDRLDILVNKLQPQVKDSLTKKVKKAGESMFYEDEMSKILIKLESYKTSFMLHFTDISIDLDEVTKKAESYYMVPCLQVSEYVERIDLLESVKSAVQQRREQQQRQVVVLLGMGGQGKSQLAAEYCRTARLSKEFRAIFWIDAFSINSTHRSFERIALKMADPSRVFESIEEKIIFVKDTMDSWDSHWLLVFDNYDTPSTDFNVGAFFPSSPLGTILVTSRHEDSKRLGKVIPVAKMTEQESLELLFHRSENELTGQNMEIGKSIVAKLQFLPLAIDQAGAFISAQKLPLTLFLERFELQKEEILKYTPSLTEYRRILSDDGKEIALNVFTTWELSFQQIRKDETGERLRTFLTTAAFFNSRDIGEDLFHGANDLETVPLWIDAFISEGAWDSIRYRFFLAELSKLSLLNFAIEDTKQCRFYLHPLIADWLRLRVDLDKRRQCTIESCYLLAKLIESTDLDSCSYAFRLYLLEHVDECLNNKRVYSMPVDEDVRFVKILIDQFGLLLQETSRYREGISLVEEALPIIETAYGKDHASVLDTVSFLGNLYQDQGKLAEAEEMYKRALAGKEKALGKDHESTLTTVNNLGNLYTAQGKLAEAEEMYKRALAGCEKALGKDHALTLSTVNDLGSLYRDQGKMAEAEEMLKRALAGREKALRKDHARTLITVHNLGSLYRDQGKMAEAEEMLKRGLAGREKALGKDHASTLTTVNNLGKLYREQGKLAAAEEMYKRAFAGYEKALGKDHAWTLTTVNNLGNLYRRQGKLAEAEEMLKRALAGFEKALGKYHTLTLLTVNNLGSLYQDQGKFAEAEEMLKRALAGREKALGKDHESTLTTVNNLGNLYTAQGKLAEAEEMYKRALAGCEKALGKDHALTLSTVNDLGSLYRDQGKMAEAEEMLKRALAGREKAIGKDHASTLATVNHLGNLYQDQGKFAEAEEMYNHALVGTENALGKDHSSTLLTVNYLGNLYREQGKLAEAEEMLKRALAGREKALGKDHASTLSSVDNLGILYQEQGKLAEAEEMLKRALAGREMALGKDHALTLSTVNSLGNLYRDQGKLGEAEELYMRALAGQEKALGRDHKNTLNTVCDMAKLMEEQRDLEGASLMLERASFGYTNLLGADNLRTMDARKQQERINYLQQKKVNTKKGFWKSLCQRLN